MNSINNISIRTYNTENIDAGSTLLHIWPIDGDTVQIQDYLLLVSR